MPSFRRYRYPILTIILLALTLWYVTTAQSSTQSSAFFVKTAAAIERRRNEGPQAPGPAVQRLAKRKSNRLNDQRQLYGRHDSSPADDNAWPGVESGSGLDIARAALTAGKTSEEVELDRQIAKARRRADERLKSEIRDALKIKERERQRFLTYGKVLNPHWVGAFEKARRPPVARKEDEEVAPADDPFRNQQPPTDDGPLPPADLFSEHGSTQDREDVPDAFLDLSESTARKPHLESATESRQVVEQRIEHQQLKLAKEQETLFAEPVHDAMPQRISDTVVSPPGSLQFSADDSGEPDVQARHHLAQQLDAEVVRAELAEAGRADTHINDASHADVLDRMAEDDSNTAADDLAAAELARISALSPITIFSKTRCPFSKKAKRILLEAVDITPTPYVVELDRHELGSSLQRLLLEKTGRGTVPNVIVEGHSIGGGDDIERLWEAGKLKDVIMKYGGTKIMHVVDDKDFLRDGWQ